MNEEQLNRLIEAIGSHADQQGGNLAKLKGFLAQQQKEQRDFLAGQRAASDTSQRAANRAAVWSAIAATIVASAAIVQAYAAITERSVPQAAIEAEGKLLPSPDDEVAETR
ncbi:hypothetical protein [Erythrobacter sp. JK5]|uniref:hypothetical protein n=1 Tax=Erythrobacter sp. JK5 TaxID=2829500 RepID=UPI001BAB3A4E|nr:hypothetical protein [Erythrobacter sp. JK5]QUL39173.1 hypothetical protein KDC96_07595 [Erythrobacter sp. JK5]